MHLRTDNIIGLIAALNSAFLLHYLIALGVNLMCIADSGYAEASALAG